MKPTRANVPRREVAVAYNELPLVATGAEVPEEAGCDGSQDA